MIVSGASAYPRILDFKRIREICDKVGALMMVDIAHIAGLVAAGLHPIPYRLPISSRRLRTRRCAVRAAASSCVKNSMQRRSTRRCSRNAGRTSDARHRGKGCAFKEALSPEFKAYQQQIVKNAAAMADRFINNGVRLVSGGTDNHLMLVDLRKEGMTGKELEALLDRAHITANKNTIPFETTSPFITSGVRIGTPAITSRGMKEQEAIKIADLVTEVIWKKEEAVADVSDKVHELCAAFPIYEGISADCRYKISKTVAKITAARRRKRRAAVCIWARFCLHVSYGAMSSSSGTSYNFASLIKFSNVGTVIPAS